MDTAAALGADAGRDDGLRSIEFKLEAGREFDPDPEPVDMREVKPPITMPVLDP